MADSLPPPTGPEHIVDANEATFLNPSALSSNPKDAYFQLLRIWVQQANLAQNASACFPYYLAANYPQMYAASAGLLPFPGSAMPLHQMHHHGANGGAGAAAGPVDANQQLRMSFNRLLDNPARNTESKT